MRIEQCLRHHEFPKITQEDIRLWRMERDTQKIRLLLSDIRAKTRGQKSSSGVHIIKGEMDGVNGNSTSSQKYDVEVNSGVDFPGDSLEPIMKLCRLDEPFYDTIVVVEVRDCPNFLFRFIRNE